jgi:hypothetical protein
MSFSDIFSIDYLKAVVSDQEQRFSNVYETEKAVVKNIISTTGLVEAEKISATNETSVFGQISATVANNPKTAAAIIAIPFSSTARGLIATSVSKLPTIVKAAAVVASPIVAGFAVKNPVGTSKIVLETPSNLNNIGQNVGTFAKDPSIANAEKIFIDDPFTITAITGAAAAAVGAVGFAIQGASNELTRMKIEDVADAINNLPPPSSSAPPPPSSTPPPNSNNPSAGVSQLPTTPSSAPAAVPSPQPITPATQIIGRPVSSSNGYRKKAKKVNSTPSVNVRVNLLNQNNYKSRLFLG